MQQMAFDIIYFDSEFAIFVFLIFIHIERSKVDKKLISTYVSAELLQTLLRIIINQNKCMQNEIIQNFMLSVQYYLFNQLQIMFRKVFLKIPELFLQIIHSNPKSQELDTIVAIIHAAQQISIIYDYEYKVNEQLSLFFAFFQYCLFIDTNLFADQLQIIIALTFIINILFTFLYLILLKQNKMENIKISSFLHFFVLYYPQIFLIPVFYSSLKYLSTYKNVEYCYITFSIINIFIALFIKTLHNYFCRANQLMGNSYILLINGSFFLHLVGELILHITIIFKIYKISNLIRLITLSLKHIIFIIQLFSQQNCNLYIHIYIVTLVTNISLYLQPQMCEYLVYCSLSSAFIQNLLNIINQIYLYNDNNFNIISLQILERYQTKGDRQSILIFHTIFRMHKNQCFKCQSFKNIICCIFTKIIQYQQNLEITLLYCYYIMDQYPLEAAIQIFKTQQSNYYFKYASKILLRKLFLKGQQLLQRDSRFQKLKENDNYYKLDTKSVSEAIRTPDLIFPLFNKIIEKKINLWVHLIKGYTSIQICMEEVFQLSQLMLNCKNKISELFDLQNQKLIHSNYKDVISMKVLQLYYCIIYDNKFISFSLQQQINEQLKIGQLLQDECLNSFKLAKNQVFLFQTSLIKNQGELLNLNKKNLSNFFNIKEDILQNFINYEQIMPEFIGRQHQKFVEQFIQRGYSKHEFQRLNSFYQTTEGYLEPCSLNLYYFYTKEDFIMNLLLSKNQIKQTLIFGVDGVILGISKQFFEEIVASNFAVCSYSHSDTVSQIKEFLSYQPLIQFYIPNIAQQIEQIQKESRLANQSLLNNVKSSWVFPLNHAECLNFSRKFLQQFSFVQKCNLQNECYDEFQQLGKLDNSLETFIYSPDIFSEFNDQLEINGIPILLLLPVMQNQLYKFIEFGDITQSQFQLTLQYRIEFNYLEYQYGKFGYFILTIENYNPLNMASLLCFPSYRNLPFKFNVIENSVSQEISQQISKMQGLLINQEPEYSEFKQDNKKNQYPLSLSNEGEQLNFSDMNNNELMQLRFVHKSTESQPVQLDTYKGQKQDQGLLNKSKPSENFNFDDIDLNDYQDQFQQKIKNEDERKKQKYNLRQLKKMKQNIVLTKKNEKFGDLNHEFASNSTRSSSTSTIKETQILMEQLYFKQGLIVPLKKIALTLLTSILGILVCCILNYFLVKNNLEEQLSGVDDLVSPQNITYFYSSVYYQMWCQELHNKNIIRLSQFQYQNNLKTLNSMFYNGRIYLPILNIIVPKQEIDLGVQIFETKFIVNDAKVIVNYDNQDFYLMLNQITEKAYRELVIDPKYSMGELYATGFIRQNIIDLFVRADELANQVIINTQLSYIFGQNSYIIDIFIQLICIILTLIVTIKYWIFLDKLQKQIIFLLSSVNETQALKHIEKLTQFKQQIDDQFPNKWIQVDFNEIEFNSEKISKIKNITKNNKKSDYYLNSRIATTKYFSPNNFIILGIIILSFILFQVIGYFIFVYNHNVFQPMLQATMKFGQFRIKIDITSILGGIIKTENLLSENNLSFINQSQVTQLFSDCRNQLVPLIEEIASTLLQLQTSSQSEVDELLNGNICDQLNWTVLPSCDPSKQQLPYDDFDITYNLLQYGILGYTSAFIKYLNSDFDFELKNHYYNTIEQNQLAIKSSSFENYFLSFYCDIQDNFFRFLNQFKIQNQQIAEQCLITSKLYNFLVGSLYVLALCILSWVWIYNFDKRIMKIRQILVLVHSDILLNLNMKNRAKLILNWLY